MTDVRGRANWNCPGCDSSEVYHSHDGIFECDDCGDEIAERDGSRTAHVSRTTSGDPIGVAVFLNAHELNRLGIDPGSVRRVEYEVDDGRLCLAGQGNGDDDGSPR